MSRRVENHPGCATFLLPLLVLVQIPILLPYVVLVSLLLLRGAVGEPAAGPTGAPGGEVVSVSGPSHSGFLLMSTAAMTGAVLLAHVFCFLAALRWQSGVVVPARSSAVAPG